jgi:hypothetical protein
MQRLGGCSNTSKAAANQALRSTKPPSHLKDAGSYWYEMRIIFMLSPKKYGFTSKNIQFHVVKLKFTYKTNIEISDGRIEQS